MLLPTLADLLLLLQVPLMRLLHIIKMIFNVSSFYNSSERVASLLVKITNQVIMITNLVLKNNN